MHSNALILLWLIHYLFLHMNKLLLFFALLIVLIFGFLYFVFMSSPKELPGTDTVVVVDGSPKLLSEDTLVCNDGKTINASFFENRQATSTIGSNIPTSDNFVKLTLDDGRTFELTRAVSADGGRYANDGDVFVFWSKGNGALVLENGAEKTYRGCVRVASVDASVKLPVPYADREGTFSLRLPGILSSTTLGYNIDEQFSHVITPKKSIDGVKFTIPTALATGTNLSQDSYFSIEQEKETSTCIASSFLTDVSGTTTMTQGGVSYSLATSSGAAAGNRYEEIVYALAGTNPCVAVHYFIHHTALENYPKGTVTEFNKKALVASFDQIRQTLVVNQ